ncbi:MAG: hypothetical protein GC151_08605 [Betaproteobacteria bacterium]|nr:hypothetical protein [Betaproteobacteria bacterium]
MSCKRVLASIPALILLLVVHLDTARANSMKPGTIVLNIHATLAGELIADKLYSGTGLSTAIPKVITAAYIANLILAGNGDPWLNLTYVLENRSDTPGYFSLNLALVTQDTAGPTYKDAFMDLILTDSNGDGSASLNGISASFSVADERPGAPVTPVQSIAYSAPYTDYSDAGTYSVFDVAGPVAGPDSSTIPDGSPGFNELRFLASGHLSPHDSIELHAFGCYANDFADCPARFVISPSAVPLPATVWLFGTGLVVLAGFAGKRNGVSHRGRAGSGSSRDRLRGFVPACQ